MLGMTGKKKRLAELAMFMTAAIWGSGFIVTRICFDSGFSAGLLLALRFVIASIVLFFVFRRKLFNINREQLTYGLISGFLLFIAFAAQTYGLKLTTPSNNAFLTSTCVIIVPFYEWIAFKKRPKNRAFISAVVFLIGMAILTWGEGAFSLNLGDSLTILCALLFSGHIISVSMFAAKIETEKFMFLQMATSAVCATIFFLIFDLNSMPQNINWTSGLLATSYLGVFGTCIAFFIQTSAQKVSTATTVTIILSTEALFCSIFSTALGYEPLTVYLIFGGLIIMSAIMLLEAKFKLSS